MKTDRYYVTKSIDKGSVRVIDTKKDIEHKFLFQEFITGQALYNEKTDNFPNYVHRAVWRLFPIT